MRGWGAVLGVFVAVVLTALVLKALPPVVFIVLVVVAGSYGYHRYRLATVIPPQQLEASSLGLERAAVDRFGLLGYPLHVLARGADRSVEGLLFGTWRTLEVKLFDLRYTESGGQEKRLSCALAPLDVEAAAILIEPRTFFTPPETFVHLGELTIGPAVFREAFEIRGGDLAFTEVLLDERMRAWLLEIAEWGFELSGRWLLCYAPRSGVRDSLGVLQTLAGFVDRIPSAVRDRYRAQASAAVPDDPRDRDVPAAGRPPSFDDPVP
jgi:hypothetical protein